RLVAARARRLPPSRRRHRLRRRARRDAAPARPAVLLAARVSDALRTRRRGVGTLDGGRARRVGDARRPRRGGDALRCRAGTARVALPAATDAAALRARAAPRATAHREPSPRTAAAALRRSLRLAGDGAGGRPRLPLAAAGRSRTRGRVRPELRPGGSARPLRPGARAADGALRSPELLALGAARQDGGRADRARRPSRAARGALPRRALGRLV